MVAFTTTDKVLETEPVAALFARETKYLSLVVDCKFFNFLTFVFSPRPTVCQAFPIADNR